MAGMIWILRGGRGIGLTALYGFLLLTAMAVVENIYVETASTQSFPIGERAAWVSALLLLPLILLSPDPFPGRTATSRWAVALVRAAFGTLWFHHLVWYWSEGVLVLHTENLWWLADPWVFIGFLLLQPARLIDSNVAETAQHPNAPDALSP